MTRPSTSNTTVTTTAMARPELIGPTYKSFQEKTPWLDFSKMTLLLNVDFCPNFCDHPKRNEVIEIAHSFFKNVIVNEIGDLPNFPAAVKWLFTNVKSEFAYHIEDDWLLLSEIPESVGEFFDNPKILQVGFKAWNIPEPRFVLSPNLIRGSFCNFIGKELTRHKNPEQQIRSFQPHDPKEAFVYWPFEEKVILQDTGRAWMKSTEYARGDDEFTRWKWVRNPALLKLNQEIRDQNAEIDRNKL